jgi:hypothetical protein
MNESTVILKAGIEGGSITLCGAVQRKRLDLQEEHRRPDTNVD